MFNGILLRHFRQDEFSKFMISDTNEVSLTNAKTIALNTFNAAHQSITNFDQGISGNTQPGKCAMKTCARKVQILAIKIQILNNYYL